MARRRARRTARRRVRAPPSNALVVKQPSPSNPPRRRRRLRRANRRQVGRVGITDAGYSFLKCAFAPPDFNLDPGKGIPDNYHGKALMKKYVLNVAKTFTAGKDTYMVVLPTPGEAYWFREYDNGTLPSSGDTFNGVPFPGFSGLFGTDGVRNVNVSAFRYASMNIGIYPTSNQMQFAGSITVWKGPVSLGMTMIKQTLSAEIPPLTLPLNIPIVNGLHAVTGTTGENFVTSFINGVYSSSVNCQADFDFSEIINDQDQMPNTEGLGNSAAQFIRLVTPGGADGAVVGCGNMDAIFIRVSTPTGAVNNAIVKVWSCVEFQPNQQSVLYEYAGTSPPLDEVALEEYRCIANELPVAVIAAQNAGFWERVKTLLSGLLNAATYVPGPIGEVATGVRGIANTLSRLRIF